MSINSRPSIRGFIAKDPRELETQDGALYVKVRFGQERKHREEDGSFTDLGKTYDTFVAYDDNDGVAASRACRSGRGNAASSPRVMRRSAASHGATQSNPATRCAASRARAPTV